MERLRLVGQTTQWPRLKKMYLILVLSTVCIFIFQFHISKAQLGDTQDPLPEASDGVYHHQEPMRELLLADTSSALQSTAVALEDKVRFRHRPISFKTFVLITKPFFQIDIRHSSEPLPPLYIITPTFRRGEQLAELTRLGYTLKHVPRLFWLVIEDSTAPTPAVTALLTRIGVPFTHLVGELIVYLNYNCPFMQTNLFPAQMPAKYRKNKVKPRGVSNRNRGLEWIRSNATEGVFFFADDDNSYDILIFEQVRVLEIPHYPHSILLCCC